MYRRVVLKLSGEILSGEGKKGFDEKKIGYLIDEIKKVRKVGTQLILVIGAGNLFRGKQLKNIDDCTADSIGMLGTTINALYLKSEFNRADIPAVVVSSQVNMPAIKSFEYDKIDNELTEGKITIFAGGTTLPFFTTDTAAIIRAAEFRADVVIKGTKVDGIYETDPRIDPSAEKISKVSFKEAIGRDLKIMDREAFSLCWRKKIPLVIINFFKSDNLLRAIKQEEIGTLVIPE
ncbi:MAG: UMP kinase [Kosmotoga sp.]|nr:MAG: UMP kinase [Kosmotoga sp.]